MNNTISKIIEDPTYAHKLTIRELEEVISYTNEKYYNTGKSVMKDNIYDVVKNILEDKSPDSKVLNSVGAPVNTKKLLPFFMGSMDKIKPDTGELERWMKKNKGPYVLSDKLDGSSGLFQRYKNDKGKWKNRFYTRGDGTYGRDITHLLRHIFSKTFLKNLPKKEMAVRGEVIISRENFDKFSENFSNPRALANGMVNSKTIKMNVAKNLDFVVFEVLEPDGMKPSEQLEFLQSLGFKTTHYEIHQKISNNMLSELLLTRRDESDYIIDGVIIQDDHIYPVNTDGNPDHSIAFKMLLSDQIIESVVLDIEWNASRHGILKPVVIYEPVTLGGTTMQRATGFNAKYIKDNKVGPGSRIKITRSGDVIPYIVGVTEGTEPKYPDIPYEWNESGIDIVLKDIESNKNVDSKKIEHFIKILDIKKIGPKTTKLFVENGIDTIKKLINATEEDFLKMDRIGGKMAENIFVNVQNGIKRVQLPIIMAASQTFHMGFGRRKFKAILKEHPNILDLSDNTDIEELVSNIRGFATTSVHFAEGLPKFKTFLKNHPEITIVVPKVLENISPDGKFSNKIFVFTGIRDKNIEKIIEEGGGCVTTSVSKNTYMVVAKDPDTITGKVKKAKEFNIKIMSFEEFKDNFI